MSDTSVSGAGRRHFSPEEEVMLQRSESTNDIAKRDTLQGVDIHGRDRTRKQIDEEQKRLHAGQLKDGAAAGVDGASFSGGVEGILHVAGASAAAPFVEGALAIVLPLVELGLGWHHLMEQHVQGAELNDAAKREVEHYAVFTALDLPADYQKQRLEDFKGLPQDSRSPSTMAAWSLKSKPSDCAVLQMHCDRGMHAARDLMASHKDVATFLEENPKVADAYVKDAAFHEGFDAYLSTKNRKALDTKLAERDGWYAQSHINVRV